MLALVLLLIAALPTAPAVQAGPAAAKAAPPAAKAAPPAATVPLPPVPAALPAELAALLTPYDGVFVLLDPASGAILRTDAAEARLRSSPCSTFKIPNAMIGLETGVIKDLDQLYKWDGTKDRRPEVNRDHTLRTAIRDSVVWYFQRLAREVGPARMKDLLERTSYGNEDISGGIDQFWLESSLQISPDEQVEFLRKLQREGDLPFSPRTMRLVKEALVQRATPISILRAKTGSAGGGKLGWYVGWVERGGQARIFAARVRRKPGQDAPEASGPGAARPIAEKILEGLAML